MEDYQARVGSFLLGPGTPYNVTAFDGDGRDVRTNDQPRSAGHGSVMGPDYLNAKSFIIEGSIWKPTAGAAEGAYQELVAAWNVASLTEGRQGLTTLYWKWPGAPARRVDGRPRQLVPNRKDIASGWITFVGDFGAPDPRMLAHDLGDGPTGERIIDLDIGATATIPNAGNHPAAVWFDIYGAVTNPGVIRDEAARFDITGTIPNGTFYRVRTDKKTVTKSTDSSNQYATRTGTWLEVPPGGAVFRAVGTSPGANAKVRLTYRDTWL